MVFSEERGKYHRILMVVRQKMRDNKPFEAYDLLCQVIEDMERKNA